MAKSGNVFDIDRLHQYVEFMKENDIEPKQFILFTDGYPCGGWGDAQYCDTVFLIHGNQNTVAPFGITVHYEEPKKIKKAA